MQYIQLKTGIQFASVRRIDGKLKEVFNLADDANHTTYIDAKRAKSLAFALLEAAKNYEAIHAKHN